MKASDNCLQLIRECEGFSTKPYLCPAHIPTIGYGSTRYADGRAVTLSDAPITTIQADALLRATVAPYEEAVTRMVIVPLTQAQFDALVDFAYNVGTQNLRISTLLRKLNTGDYNGAAAQFGVWVNGGGRRLPGLVARREKERQLFQPDAPQLPKSQAST